jgi:cytochrome oxidase Cu insertion factor (SCO1/SenC/PrrC family)
MRSSETARLTRDERWAVTALGAVAAVTVAWWALALWPAPSSAPEWLERTRQVCFGTTQTGLPDSGGWLLLVGQPAGMLVAMFVIWGEALRGGLGAMTRSLHGRATLLAATSLLVLGMVGAGVRVAGARPVPIVLDDAGPPPETYPRLDRDAPTVALLDQHGDLVTLGRWAGRPVLVTFAFGHCETICPVVVHNVLEAAAALPELDPAVVVITLDPWRDTPSRLPYIAEQWGLDDDDAILSGSVKDVEVVLDEWQVARERDGSTGDITHPALVYILDADGRVAFASTGDPQTVVALALRL